MTTENGRLDAPRHDLIRGLMPMRAEDNGNVMVGYPIVFNIWTEINSWEGHFLERVLPSGPVKAIKETADRIKVQYNHGMHPTIGTSGLGKPRKLEPQRKGVYTETPLSDTSYNRDIIKPLLADGVLNGMSFRFSVVEDRWVFPEEPSDHNPAMLPERSLVEFKWHEYGPVDWPAYEAALAGIRSQAAFSLWVQTPQEQRAELMRQHDIAPTDSHIWVPGWEKPKTAAPSEERDKSADEPVTDEEAPLEERDAEPSGAPDDESGPDDEATRSDDEADRLVYQPARPTPISRERLESRRGLVEAWAAIARSE